MLRAKVLTMEQVMIAALTQRGL
eukprot:COSAG03_NODE_18168_length_360_cov_1.195402_1_plen_22_part_01